MTSNRKEFIKKAIADTAVISSGPVVHSATMGNDLQRERKITGKRFNMSGYAANSTRSGLDWWDSDTGVQMP